MKEEQQSHSKCKVDHQKNGGTVRWNTVVNCEISGRWQDNTREKFWEQFEGPPIFCNLV